MKKLEKFIVKNEDEMLTLASSLAEKYSENKLIILIGPIGVGKTVFVRGFAQALNLSPRVHSPSFTIKNDYGGLLHYDLYFAKKLNFKSFFSMINEELENNNKIIIEWGEKFPLRKLTSYLLVKFNYIDNEEREIIVQQF